MLAISIAINKRKDLTQFLTIVSTREGDIVDLKIIFKKKSSVTYGLINYDSKIKRNSDYGI